MSKKFGTFSTIITIVAGFVPAPLSAGLVPACGATGACGFCDIVNVFITLGRWLITGGAGLGLVLIVWAGVGLATSGGNAEKIGAAKKQILGVIIGLGMVLAAFQLVTFLVAFVVTPSQYGSFAGSQSDEAKKIGSLTDFLGTPWWTICSEKDLRQYQGKPPTEGSTADCRFWGDGAVCQKLTSQQEKDLQEKLDKGETLTNISRCCQGKCVTGECVTEQITKPVTESGAGSNAVGTQGTALNLNDEQAVKKYLLDGGVRFQQKSCPPEDKTGRGCTNVAGLSKPMLDTLIKAAYYCDNCIVITGGTEGEGIAHKSHGIGKDTVDIKYSETALTALRAMGILSSGTFGKGYTCEGCIARNAKNECTKSGPVPCENASWVHVNY